MGERREALEGKKGVLEQKNQSEVKERRKGKRNDDRTNKRRESSTGESRRDEDKNEIKE
jgi:hypothetical protein